jgi:pimeloyl-ACP methyl ester carboxylesterase
VAFLEVPGARLRYATSGPGESPLVLIHGSATDMTTWDGVVDRLAAHGKVVTYDRRGYGSSTHSPVRDHRVHAADLIAVLEQVAERPATVVGWSSGGNVALAASIRRPDLVSRLVLIEPPFHGLRHANPAVLRTAWRLKLLQLRGRRVQAAEEFLRFGSALRSGGNGYDLAPAPVRENLIANSGPVLAEWDPHPFGVMHEHVPTRSLRRIEIPVTWVLGGESPPWMATLHSHAVRHLPRVETVVVEKAGHLVHLDQPAAFIEAVAKARRSDAPDSRMSEP